MSTAPDMGVLAASREASDRASSLEVLSEGWPWSGRERLVIIVLILVVFASNVAAAHFRLPDEQALAVAIMGAVVLITAGFSIEIYRLRRRVEALTYLLLRHERTHEP